jgi:uncharacterized protein YkwD
MMMKKVFFALAFCLVQTIPYAQTATDKIDTGHVNFDLVEKLFLEKLNQYRQSLSLPTLSTSTVLKQAATDQAQYQQKTKKLSHFQETNKKKYSPLDRISYYRGKCRVAGENTLFTWIGVPVYNKNTGQTRLLQTYQDAADGLFEQWKTSPSHHHTMVGAGFESTGLGFAFDAKEKKLYAVQVFAGTAAKKH